VSAADSLGLVPGRRVGLTHRLEDLVLDAPEDDLLGRHA